ncbi:MAG TPA: translation initiation factor eIF-1A [Nanoarchaeota archaeon]|nr:translation initiation factor eIF-1A [Nanoarchaeota archaeon]
MNDFKRRVNPETPQQEIQRVRLPRGKEVLGIVETRLGFGKSRIKCADGKTRICRVPGALKRALWVRPDNIVLVKPWEFEGDAKGDIIYKYTDNQARWLKEKGHLKALFEQKEF